ncbi:MAG: ABC transporter substrate-binding protein [Acidobacteriota bacterium]
MKRRDFIAIFGGAAVAWPLVAEAQRSGSPARIGLLSPGSAFTASYVVEAFRAGLRDLGYVEGKDVVLEFRFGEGDPDRLPDLARELLALDVDVIVTNGPGTLAARQVTSTTPIVMAVMGDAVGTGVIASLARPGGNITGSTFFYPDLMAKRLQMLKEVIPSLSRAGVLQFPGYAPNVPSLSAMEAAAKTLGIELHSFDARGPDDFESAFGAMADSRIGGIVFSDHPLLLREMNMLVAMALAQRLPSIGALELTAAGGLMAYGVDFRELYRRAAYFVDRILKGAKPADLPAEQPTKLHMAVNLGAAKALGLIIPQSILIRADEVIE